jgi:hypothetical protein
MPTKLAIIERDEDPERWGHAIGTIMSLCTDLPKCHQVLSLPWLQNEASLATVMFLAYPSGGSSSENITRQRSNSSLTQRLKSWLVGDENKVSPMEQQPQPLPLPQPTAFLLASEDDNAMILEDMFATHNGGAVLTRFIDWARSRDGIERIELHALPGAVGFYLKHGFTFSDGSGKGLILKRGEPVPSTLHKQLVEDGIYDSNYQWYSMVLRFNNETKPTSSDLAPPPPPSLPGATDADDEHNAVSMLRSLVEPRAQW